MNTETKIADLLNCKRNVQAEARMSLFVGDVCHAVEAQRQVHEINAQIAIMRRHQFDDAVKHTVGMLKFDERRDIDNKVAIAVPDWLREQTEIDKADRNDNP